MPNTCLSGEVENETHFVISYHIFNIYILSFTPYQQNFSSLMVTVHKSMFPGQFLTSTKQVDYPDTGEPVVVPLP